MLISPVRSQPRHVPFEIGMMERQTFGSQSVSPLSGRPFWVAVADDEDGRPGEPRVFLASGDQGVNYRRNIWHHPLMATGAISDFLVVDRDRPETNLEEFTFETPYLIAEPSP